MGGRAKGTRPNGPSRARGPTLARLPGPGYSAAMKVVVVDARERFGELLVGGALSRGHQVTAFGASRRPPAEVGPGGAQGGLRTVSGDLLDRVAVAAAVAGQEAVLYAVEPPAGRGRTTRASQGMLNIVRAMSAGRVRRLICLSIGGPGSEPQGDQPGLVGRLFRSSPARGALADLRQMEVTVRQSGLDWTIVRPAKLVDGAGKHLWRRAPGYALSRGTKIARADVAEFMLGELESSVDVGHAVAIAW